MAGKGRKGCGITTDGLVAMVANAIIRIEERHQVPVDELVVELEMALDLLGQEPLPPALASVRRQVMRIIVAVRKKMRLHP